MTKFKQLFVACLLAGSAINVYAEKPAEWKLVWKDEFNKKINNKKWSKIQRGNADWKNFMSPDERLYDVRDGKLILRGMVNDNPADTATYITGGLETKGKFSIDYGKVEIRAKLPSATGCWPAFWMLPDIEDRKWPDSGEIDIMEHLNFDNIIYQTVHTKYTYVLKQTSNPQHSGTSKANVSDWNVYGVEKHPDKIVFLLNGKETFTYPRRPDLEDQGQWPFNDPYYILIDMQLGGSWVGKIDPAHLPVEMEIDWVRVYKQK
ncbi:MAG: glycoside hydrolase family 16 protein [Bacteroidales bacterium]